MSIRPRFRWECVFRTRGEHALPFSAEEGLEREFNSLDARRESGEAFVKSQSHE
nr:hypothetical protein Hi04_10k_c2220_00032 [uncultured bacterium]